MIEVHGLRKLYDDYLAVDDVTFTLGRGAVCGLVGKNGAGKTTTMRCIAGLIGATEGRIRVADCDVADNPIELKRRLAYVPDDPPLFDDLSVREHLHFIGRIYRVEDYREESEKLLRQFELQPKANDSATTLSRGMRQKLAIACAYLHRPQVLLLDEPMTGLDPPGIRTLLDSIAERANQGTTVVLSSHLLVMIEEVCSEVIMMNDGTVAHAGSVEDIKKQHGDSKSLEAAYFASHQDMGHQDTTHQDAAAKLEATA